MRAGPLCGVTVTEMVVSPLMVRGMLGDVTLLATVSEPGLTTMLWVAFESAIGLTVAVVSLEGTAQA